MNEDESDLIKRLRVAPLEEVQLFYKTCKNLRIGIAVTAIFCIFIYCFILTLGYGIVTGCIVYLLAQSSVEITKVQNILAERIQKLT